MKRIFLFLGTNLAIVLVLSVTLRLLGIDQMLYQSGSELNLGALLAFAAVFGFGGSFLSLAISKWMAKRMTGAVVITEPRNQTERWLVTQVERLALESGIAMPEVAIYQSADVNAFATGMRRNAALVAVSTGLLEHMNEDEALAVLAHEVSHVANGDMVTLGLIQGVVNTFVIFIARVIGHTVDRVIFKNERGYGPGYWITTIVAEMVLAVLASIIVMWFSRQREYRADAGAARLVGAPRMIGALEKLRRDNTPAQLPDQIAAFAISGSRNGGIKALFMSHPPLEDRIAALKEGRHL